MSEIENIELARHQREIVEDLRHMLKQYTRIMEWDVPDVDADSIRPLVLKALKAAFAEVEAEG